MNEKKCCAECRHIDNPYKYCVNCSRNFEDHWEKWEEEKEEDKKKYPIYDFFNDEVYSGTFTAIKKLIEGKNPVFIANSVEQAEGMKEKNEFYTGLKKLLDKI